MSSGEYQQIRLPLIQDARGSLLVAEEGHHIPFATKRIFVIYDVAEGSSRGGHAHLVQEQFLIMLAGNCQLIIDDGRSRTSIALRDRVQGLYVPPHHWLELTNFSNGAICVVMASGPYDEADYIRDYAAFKRLVGSS